jgi:hypothetical protein
MIKCDEHAAVHSRLPPFEELWSKTETPVHTSVSGVIRIMAMNARVPV